MSGGRGAPRSSFERFVTALGNAGLRNQVRGDHAQSECPTHSDNHPSLSADYIPADAKTVFHDQAGCNANDVLAALDLTWPMLFDDYEEPAEFVERRARERAAEPTGTKRTRAKSPRSKTTTATRGPALPKGRLPERLLDRSQPQGDWAVTTTYDYCDQAATLVQQEVRHQRPVTTVDAAGVTTTSTEKRFTQRWPARDGGWLVKTPDGFVPVLYRLPDLVDWISQARRIWLCEGAKDADRFLDVGEAATTNPSGAMNFKKEQAESLAGGHIIAVLDHDLAGYKRGRRLATVLDGTVSSLRFALPCTDGRHQDASDHFDAGYGLEDFVEVTVEQLTQLERVAEAEEAARSAVAAAGEAAARRTRAAEAEQRQAKAAVEREQRYSTRWAAEAGKHLVRARGVFDAAVGWVDLESQQRLVAAVAACQEAVTSAYAATPASVPAEVQSYLVEVDLPDPEVAEDPQNNVVDLPSSGRLPEPTAQFPMSRGVWAYELGGQGRRHRGVYQQTNDTRWARVAPLPHLHARIVARDGYGRRTGTYYLVSAEHDGDRVMLGQDELVRHNWPNLLNLAVSHDDKILKAATTALVFAAEEETDLVEGTPRVGKDGKIAVPIPETLPPGYLLTSDHDRSTALAGWRKLIGAVSLSPKMALVVGASAVGPYLAGLGYQSHIVSLYGAMNQGKSVTMDAAASIWGYPGSASDAGTKFHWNLSAQGPTTYLGELGTLPAFFDEHGMAAPKTTHEWGQLIFRITQGASRGRPAPNGRPGFSSGRQWFGVLVSSGNSRLMDGVGAGDQSGTQRRVVELPTPFTLSQEHSEQIEPLSQEFYGHVGQEILARHSLTTVRAHAQRAAALIGSFEHESPTAQRMLEHVTAHVAGALILDEICGSGHLLTDAAVAGAQEYLAQWSAPVSDADRVITWLNDSLFGEPSRWPTVEQYLTSVSTPSWGDDDPRSALPVGGIDRNRLGVISNDGSWIGVIPTVWETMTTDLKADSDRACRELLERNILMVQSSGDSFQSTVRVGKSVRVYKLSYPGLFPAEEDDLSHPQTGPDDATTPDPSGSDHAPEAPASNVNEEQGGVTEPNPSVTGRVTGDVTGATTPLTWDVTGVTGGPDDISRRGAREDIHTSESEPIQATTAAGEVLTKLDEPTPCSVCGEPTRYLVNGTAGHAGAECAEQLLTTPTTAQETTTPTPDNSEPNRNQAADESSRSGAKEPRFAAPVAILEPDLITLPGDRTVPWAADDCAHLGELAMWTDRLRLGHGGGELLPEPGQLWVTSPDVLTALGFPATLDLPPEVGEMTPDDARREIQKALREYESLPVVVNAVEQGWQISRDGHLDAWTRVSHPELLPRGAMVVFMPWARILDVPLIARANTAAQLADNLAQSAQVLGVQFKIHPGITAHNLINHTRPPRADAYSLSGNHADRVALIRSNAAELPPFLRDPHDHRFRVIEEDYNWYRGFDTLMGHEKASTTVVAWDRHASYLTEWDTNLLGVEGLVHLTGSAAVWDGKEAAGYWLIERDFTWPQLLPPPTFGAIVEGGGTKGRVWVTTATLKAMRLVGLEPAVVEAWTWEVQARYLDKAAQRLKDGVKHPNDAVAATTKRMYAGGSGRFARQKGNFQHDHLWRPDWYDHIKAWARFKMLRAMLYAAEQDVYPVAVARDTIVYVTDSEPGESWPGRAVAVGPGPGKYQLEASGSFAEWGPAYLPRPKPGMGMWRHTDAIKALTQHKQAR